MSFVIELEAGVWMASGDGDPPRTLVLENAEKYPTYKKAENRLNFHRLRCPHRSFSNSKIIEVQS